MLATQERACPACRSCGDVPMTRAADPPPPSPRRALRLIAFGLALLIGLALPAAAGPAQAITAERGPAAPLIDEVETTAGTGRQLTTGQRFAARSVARFQPPGSGDGEPRRALVASQVQGPVAPSPQRFVLRRGPPAP